MDGKVASDWREIDLGELATFRTGPFGSTFHKSDYVVGGTPLINPSHIIDGDIVPDETVTVRPELAKSLRVFALSEGEIVIGRRGDMGRCAVVKRRHEGFLCGTGSMIVRPRPGTNPHLLQSLLSSPEVIAKIEENSVGTTMINLNQGTLSALKIRMAADPKEQEAIAEALSDADALIEGLERLIAKKRLIKQGAMQDLLTAKRRLPGFSGEWVERKLGMLLTVRHGRSQKEVEVSSGRYPILATGGQIGTANSYLWDKPSVLIGRKGTIDRPQFVETPFWTVDTLFYTDIRPPNDPRFMFYVFQRIDWPSYNEASGVPSLNAKTIENIDVFMPDSDEQIAISAILTDMDAEIQALQARLEKAQQVKEGMMQNLLTGRIRLV